MDPQKLGAMLREVRARADISQQELAQRLGVRASAIEDWERGKGLKAAARFLGALVFAATGNLPASSDTHEKSASRAESERPYGDLIADLAEILRVEDDDPLGLYVIKPKRSRKFTRAQMDQWQEPMVSGLQRAIDAERRAGRRK